MASGNILAIGLLTSELMPFIDNRINSYKYTFADLKERQKKTLMRMNNLNDDDNLIGGDILRVMCDIKTKKMSLIKVGEIDFFKVLSQITQIKEQNIKL